MRKMMFAVIVTAIGLALLLSFKPHDVAGLAPPPAAVQTRHPGQPDPGSGGQTSAPSSPSAASAGTRTVDGGTVDTRWGPVQVRITVTGSRITDVQALHSPDGNRRDLEISDVALPILRQETLSAQSAKIDAVSGATYTSDGYTRSLQSAIDRSAL
ncbi:FMN-binding protein [Nonomuraea jabiensis]|uniref:FMN-binding protein n=1 Tax=Nonomuraea jabiensis TaxID=882448 RepID=UPI003435E2B8